MLLCVLSINNVHNTLARSLTHTLAFAQTPQLPPNVNSSGKAARQMYFRALALEEADSDQMLTVLNYSPGPVQTEMTFEIENNAVASDIRTLFKGLREEKTILQPIDTTMKFIQVIEKGDYESGANVDYYDWTKQNRNRKIRN